MTYYAGSAESNAPDDGTLDELGRFWFVAFDGGDIPSRACALLAEERDPGAFYGFWTYDPALVDRPIEYVRATYSRECDGDGDHRESETP